MNAKVLSVACLSALALFAASSLAQTINLPSTKQLIEPVPGHPQKLNSLPMSIAISPDGHYVVTVNAGYGTAESQYDESLAVMDTRTGAVADFPDTRTGQNAKQTLYSGLAFSRDGAHLFVSMGSETDPTGDAKDATGSGIAVFSFAEGKIAPERFMKIPLVDLAAGHTTRLIGEGEGAKGLPFPAAIAITGAAGAEKLLVAGNQTDDVWWMDAATGAIEKRFDLAESSAVPAVYPIAIAVSKDAHRAFVALWNASEIVELDLVKGTVGRKLALLKPANPVAPGSHPCALELAPDGKTLYVALANRDAVAAVNVAGDAFSLKGYFDTRLPGQSYLGAEPDALAVNADGSRLYVIDSGVDAVAVVDTTKLAKKGMTNPIGFVPTEWMPIEAAYLNSSSGGTLYVATAKGKGTTANGTAPDTTSANGSHRRRAYTYICTLLYGSLAAIDASEIEKNLASWTDAVVESNRIKAAQEKIEFAGGKARIHHVIYVIKENRTYDQILGDLEKDGKPVGNGDPSMTMYGASTTPNEHKLALQFGVLDNFYDSGDVSGNGHVWSNAAIGSDYLDKTWQQSYRASQRTYDFEGVVANDYPLLKKIPDVNEPGSGYLWGNLAAHGKSYYHFGEFVSSTFCNDEKSVSDPQMGPLLKGRDCKRQTVEPGETFPAEWGGGVNKWPWAVPLLAVNVATKPELVGHFAPEAPDFELTVPDQIRVNIFERHLKDWAADREHGNDTMPSFVNLRLANDHTAGTRPGSPTPKASVADNDLAVGRLVEDISHSPFWDDTAIFILEDDAQDGGDHVDAHRSLALVISKYAPHASNGGAVVDSHFYATVSVVRTMESLLGLPPMNNNDAFAPLISPLFTGPGDQEPYTADRSNDTNGLIYTANAAHAPGASASLKMDFRHADHADPRKLNVILWKDAMGSQPVPAMLKAKPTKRPRDDDDD